MNNSINQCIPYSDYLVLSQFTVGLFEDSGWYKGNYTALERLNQLPLEWGKGIDVEVLINHNSLLHVLHTGLGCSFLNQRCTSKTVYPYLCDTTTEESTCTYDHLTKVSTFKRYETTYIAVIACLFDRVHAVENGEVLMDVQLLLLLRVKTIVDLLHSLL